jgi:RHS repeat-associated protein
VQRSYEYDDCNTDGLAGSTICHEVGNRRLKKETTCYGAASPSTGACLTGLSHTVTYKNLTGRDWDNANGRHYNTEEHSGSLGNDTRTVTTYWAPSVSPWLPNLYTRKTDTQGSSVQDHYFEFDTGNGFARGEFLYDSTRRIVFLTCRYNDGFGSVGQDFLATYPGQTSAPPNNTCSIYYPAYPTVAVGVNGDAFGKAYTHRNGLLLSARWMKDPVTPAGWYVKNFFRDFTTGWILASSDSAGVTTGYFYDSLGRVATIAPAEEAATTVDYPSPNETKATRDGGPGLSTLQQYLYDGLGRTGREIRQMPASSSSRYALKLTRYDGAGHASFESEWTGCDSLAACASASPSAGTTSSNFDPTGRPQSIRKADGATTTISYADGTSLYSNTQKSMSTGNINGTCSSGCTGGSSSTTTFRYDAFGRLIRVTEPGGSDTTDYEYDVNGKLTKVTQGTQIRSFFYDPAGNLRSETTPEKGTVTYDSYGSLGNLLSETEPGSLTLTRSYDFARRLTGVVSGGLRYLTNCYDGAVCADGYPAYFGGSRPLGKLTRRIGFNPSSPSTPTVTDDLNYSGSGGRLSAQITAIAGGTSLTTTQRWDYNALGLIAHHHHPRQEGEAPFAVSIDYDAGLPVAQYVNGIPMVTPVRYQPSGSLASYTTGIGIGHNVTTTIGQDSSTLLPRPTSISTSGASSNFATGTYSYDGAGNIMAMGSDSFSYDSRSRLISAALSGAGSQTYTYDRYGNLLTKGGNTFCSGSCANNQVSGASYVRGNLTAFAGQTFAYDGLDRMTSNNSSGFLWSYLYDGSDERIGKIPPSGSWNFTIRDEGKRVVSEYSATTIARDNVFVGSQLVLAYANAQVGASGPVWTYYASDHLGTPRLVTDASGTSVESRRYWPYGDAVPTQSPFESLRFASMEFDAEGGTAGGLASDRYYDHARSHVAGVGRFFSADKLGGRAENPQTWNRYAYALNSPIGLLDTDGRQPTAFQEASAKIAQIADTIAFTAEAFAAVPFQGEAISQAAGLVGLAAQTLNLGTATGEAIGAGGDAFTLTNAIASDVLTASLFTFTVAGGARSAGVGAPKILFRGFGDEGPGFAPGKPGSRPFGASWTDVDPRTVPNFRDAAGLPNQNTGRFVIEGKLINRKGVVKTTAKALHGNKGGITEYVVPNPESQIRVTRVEGVNPPF